MSDQQSLITKLGLDRSDFVKGLKDAAKDQQAFEKEVEASSKRTANALRNASRGGSGGGGHTKELEEGLGRVKDGFREIAGVAGLSLGIGGFVEAGKRIVEFASQLHETSESLGIGVEDLQRLQFAFQQSGVGAEQFKKGLAHMSEELGAAKEGSADAEERFERLGVTWDDIANRSPDEIFLKIADYAKNAADPVQALADVCAVLGKRAGVDMVAGLKLGSAGIAQLGSTAAVVSEEDVKDLKSAQMEMDKLANLAKVWGARALVHAPKMAASALTGGVSDVVLGAFQGEEKAPPVTGTPVGLSGAVIGATGTGGAQGKPGVGPLELRRQAEQNAIEQQGLANQAAFAGANGDKGAELQMKLDAAGKKLADFGQAYTNAPDDDARAKIAKDASATGGEYAQATIELSNFRRAQAESNAESEEQTKIIEQQLAHQEEQAAMAAVMLQYEKAISAARNAHDQNAVKTLENQRDAATALQEQKTLLSDIAKQEATSNAYTDAHTGRGAAAHLESERAKLATAQSALEDMKRSGAPAEAIMQQEAKIQGMNNGIGDAEDRNAREVKGLHAENAANAQTDRGHRTIGQLAILKSQEDDELAQARLNNPAAVPEIQEKYRRMRGEANADRAIMTPGERAAQDRADRRRGRAIHAANSREKDREARGVDAHGVARGARLAHEHINVAGNHGGDSAAAAAVKIGNGILQNILNKIQPGAVYR